MIRRSVISDEISQNLGEVIDVACAFRLDAIEIRTVWDTRIDLLDASAINRLRDATSAANLAISAVAPPFYKCDIDSPAERREHLEILRRSIDVAKRLRTDLVRTFTFWKTRDLDEVFDRIVEYYQEPADIARSTGVTLAVENEYACLVGTGRELARFLTKLDRPEARALWDPCNAFFAVDAEPPFPDGYDAIRSSIVHVHLKDARKIPGGPKPVLAPLGEGDVDVAGQLAALGRDGYNGYASLETHWRPEVLDEATMRLPGGAAFSERAAAATIYCLRRWDQINEQAKAERGTTGNGSNSGR
jgi:sugar phosphate isomerase/epimerase